MLERVPVHIPHDTGSSQEKLVKPPGPAVPEITHSRDRGHQTSVLAFLCESQQLPTSLAHIFYSDVWQPLFFFLWIPLIQISLLWFSLLQLSSRYSPNFLCHFVLSGYSTPSILNSCQSNLKKRGLSWEHSSVFCCFRLQELNIWNLYFGICEGLTLKMALSEGPSLRHPCTLRWLLPQGLSEQSWEDEKEKLKKSGEKSALKCYEIVMAQVVHLNSLQDTPLKGIARKLKS